jgi:hypothetical protein
MVFDGMSCERNVIGVQNLDSGVTVQNSYFGCVALTMSIATPQGRWDQCDSTQPQYGIACVGSCTSSNVLVRYNVFFANAGGTTLVLQPDNATFGAMSNNRVVGNIFMGPVSGCTNPGVTCANNSFGSGVATAGSSVTSLTCDPFVDSDQSNSNTWSETTELDPRLSGASCNVPTLDPSTLGADYQLGFDIDQQARGASSTRPGADG